MAIKFIKEHHLSIRKFLKKELWTDINIPPIHILLNKQTYKSNLLQRYSFWAQFDLITKKLLHGFASIIENESSCYIEIKSLECRLYFIIYIRKQILMKLVE